MTGSVRSRTMVLASGVALLVCLFRSAPVRAEPEGAAESLFLQARQLMKAGDCAAALTLLERSHALEPTIGTSLNMGICAERLGRLTRATEHFQAVLEGSPSQDERRVHAERALRGLSARIPRVVLEFDESRHTLERALVDGVTLSKLHPNEPYPLDPGQHRMEVVLKGEPPQVRTFELGERQTYTWVLAARFGAERPASAPAPAAATYDPRRAADSTPSPGPPPAWEWTARRIAAVVASGTAVAAIATGTGFALSAVSIHRSSDPYCQPNDVCETHGIERRDRALDQGRIATIGFTVGIASALAATTLWLTGGEPSRAASPSPSPRIGASLGDESASILLDGTY